MTRLAWLDALRGWAAAVVAVFHLSPVVLGRDLHLRIFAIIDLGKYGVLLFFLVSGYVIPMSLERHGDLRRFWTGRLLRIYPAYLFAVLVTIGLAAAGIVRMPDQLAGETTASVLGHLTMLQDLIGTRGVLRPFWTLSFEMVFYLVVAGLFVWGRHRDSAWWAAGLTLAAVIGPPSDLLGGSPAARRITAVAAAVLLGAVLWAYLSGKRRLALAAGTAGLAAIALPLLNGHATDMVTSASSAQATQMLAVMFAGTVIYRAQHRESSSRVAIPVLALVAVGVAMRTSPSVAVAVGATFAIAFLLRERWVPGGLVRLGAISYSLYLLHLPVLAVIRWGTPDPMISAVAFLIGAPAVAWAGHRWVERPAQALARRDIVINIATQGTDARTGSFGKRYESV
ncbi:acyltransferase family protein [Actinoplanes sp. CA-252034]|uniref:acyltransferase family protein n=1 Tax=Actinoplanes sp. CA-252034 TaxID=3239906 RepID=UPI003D987F93